MRRLRSISVRKAVVAVVTVLIVGAIAFCVWFLWAVSHIGDDADRYGKFGYNEDLTIQKTTADGIKYTVNNSTATFRFDVADDDDHSARLFPDYASALQYCRSHDLPCTPSVQLVHGKCKQFNDGLCAALELALQQDFPDQTTKGKHQALTRLARNLIAQLDQAPPHAKQPIENALVYVATALSLGGTELELTPDLAAKVRRTKQDFLNRPIKSRPIGFWQWNDNLKALFRQDRFLSQGISLTEHTGTCLALAAVIVCDSDLVAQFKKFRQDKKFTLRQVHKK